MNLGPWVSKGIWILSFVAKEGMFGEKEQRMTLDKRREHMQRQEVGASGTFSVQPEQDGIDHLK